MERLLFKKIELWLVGLICLGLLIVMILFGALVRNESLGHGRFGKAGEVALAIASIPKNAMDVLNSGGDNWMSVPENARFPEMVGWHSSTDAPLDGLEGFMILSRYDGDAFRSVMELYDLTTLEKLHRVEFRTDIYFADVEFKKNVELATPWDPTRFRAIHPIALEGGDMLIKDHSGPLARVTQCGDAVWVEDSLDYHHAIERGPDGHYWIPVRMPLEATPGPRGDFSNPGIAQIDADGNVVYVRSLGDLLIEQGYGHLIFTVDEEFENNTMHLNDIEPTLNDGPFWKKGDLFLSLRAQSAIIQFRPSTDEIIWLKRGPWSAQHDVDIINDHQIAIFNNDTVNFERRAKVRGFNKISVFDFETAQVTEPYNAIMEQNDLRTVYGGLFSILPNEYLMVEETGAGRLAIMNQNATDRLEYVNRAADGKIYHLGWSRYLSPDEGQTLLSDIAAQNCP